MTPEDRHDDVRAVTTDILCREHLGMRHFSPLAGEWLTIEAISHLEEEVLVVTPYGALDITASYEYGTTLNLRPKEAAL